MLAGLMGFFIIANIVLIGIIISITINKIIKVMGISNNSYLLTGIKTIAIGISISFYLYYTDRMIITHEAPVLFLNGTFRMMNMLPWTLIGPVSTAFLIGIVYIINRKCNPL